MTGLLERLKQLLATQRLLPHKVRAVVAVSGGVDSMVLLQTLHALAPEFGWQLSVAHFNHRLRGRSSDADERLVRDTARRLKLPCDVGMADVRAAAVEQGISIEMAARQLRHAFLARCARQRGAGAVVLAHHADDQVELFLLRLLRGAGGEGLAGMKVRSASPMDRRVTLVRPLLEFSKEEIAAFAREARIRFREDASNAAAEFERNWVRLELLPLMRRRQPAVGKNILRTMQIVGAEAEFVMQVADRARHPARAASYRSLPVAVQRRVIQSQLRVLVAEPDFHLIEELRTQPGKRISIGPQLDLVCDVDGVVRRVQAAPAGFESGRCVIRLPVNQRSQVPRSVDFDHLRLRWRVVRRRKHFLPERVVGREYFDADKVGARLVLRHWRAGDRFQPIGLAGATKLQDWFTNRKVSAALRRQLVLAETERGEVFWVEGERIGEVAKVAPKTGRLLELSWKRL